MTRCSSNPFALKVNIGHPLTLMHPFERVSHGGWKDCIISIFPPGIVALRARNSVDCGNANNLAFFNERALY